MIIRSIDHKGLRNFLSYGDKSGLNSASIPKLVNMISYIQAMKTAEELTAIKGWRAHKLIGDLKDYWSLTITSNRRLIFKVSKEYEIINLDIVDYH